MFRGYPRARQGRWIHENLNAPDNVRVQVWEVDPVTQLTQRLLQEFTHHNLVVNDGYDLIAALLNSEPGAAVTYFAAGTGSTTPTLSDSALQTEIFRSALTDASHATGSGLVIFSHYLASGEANGNTLREIGLFNDPSAGSMFARALLTPAIVKDITKTVTFSWTVGFGGGTSLSINRQTGYVIYLDGHRDVFSVGNSYLSGGTYDKIVPSSTVWYLLPSDLSTGTYALEAMARVDNASAIPTIGLFNLDDAPDTVLTGSEVSGGTGNLIGQRIRSGTISFGSPASAKNFGVKVKTNNAAYGAAVWGIRVIQTS